MAVDEELQQLYKLGKEKGFVDKDPELKSLLAFGVKKGWLKDLSQPAKPAAPAGGSIDYDPDAGTPGALSPLKATVTPTALQGPAGGTVTRMGKTWRVGPTATSNEEFQKQVATATSIPQTLRDIEMLSARTGPQGDFFGLRKQNEYEKGTMQRNLTEAEKRYAPYLTDADTAMGAGARASGNAMTPSAAAFGGFSAGATAAGRLPIPNPLVKGIVTTGAGMIGGGIAAFGAQKAQDAARKAIQPDALFTREQAQLRTDAKQFPTAVAIGGNLPSILMGKPTADDIRALPGLIRAARSNPVMKQAFREALQSESGRKFLAAAADRAMESGLEVVAGVGQSIAMGQPVNKQDILIGAIVGALFPGENALGRVFTGGGARAGNLAVDSAAKGVRGVQNAQAQRRVDALGPAVGGPNEGQTYQRPAVQGRTLAGSRPSGVAPSGVQFTPIRGRVGKVTNYATADDRTPDSNSKRGIGAFPHSSKPGSMIPGVSVAIKGSDLGKQLRADGIKPGDYFAVQLSNGQTQTFRWDDTIPEHGSGSLDVYNPNGRERDFALNDAQIVGFAKVSGSAGGQTLAAPPNFKGKGGAKGGAPLLLGGTQNATQETPQGDSMGFGPQAAQIALDTAEYYRNRKPLPGDRTAADVQRTTAEQAEESKRVFAANEARMLEAIRKARELSAENEPAPAKPARAPRTRRASQLAETVQEAPVVEKPMIVEAFKESTKTPEKQPWEMTADEYAPVKKPIPDKEVKGLVWQGGRHWIEDTGKDYKLWYSAPGDTHSRRAGTISKSLPNAFEKALEYARKNEVRQALEKGKPVPPEVLADYPDLAAKYKAPTEAPQAQSAKGEEAMPAPTATPAQSAPSGPVTRQSHIEFFRKFFGSKDTPAHRYTAEEFKAEFKRTVESEAAIKAELAKMTVPELKKISGSFYATKKQQHIDSAYKRMIERFHLGESISYSPMSEKYGDVLARDIEKQTDADIDKYLTKYEKSRAARLKALTNPETRDEFETFISARGESALTPEQKAAWDEVRAVSNRQVREMQEKQRATVTAVAPKSESGESVDMGVVEHFHTKRGHNVFIVQPSTRVNADTFKTLAQKARQLGGNYSRSFQGSPAGFQFDTRDAADKFIGLTKGESASRAEIVEERKEQAKSAAAERLRQLADRLEEAGQESLNANRKVNTARRAAMAESAESAAQSKITLAKTMRNLAEGMDSGEVTHLDGVKAGTHVDLMNKLLRMAKSEAVRANKDSYLDSKDRPVTEADISYAEYPYPSIHKDNLREALRAIAGKPGSVRLTERLQRRLDHLKESDWRVVFRTEDELKDLTDLQTRIAKSSAYSYTKAQIADVDDDYNRLQTMNIKSLAELRAALREFLKFKDGGVKADPVKKAERELIGTKIPGYFPTPKTLSDRIVDMADIQDGMSVLEPSAGKGNLIEAVLRSAPDADVSALEISSTLRDLLKMKGFNIIGDDFLTHGEAGEKYDRIVMNPPFENGQDIQHVQHAYTLLKPGGRMVAIMGEGAFSRSDRQATQFREWLESVGGTEEKLPDGSFATNEAERTTGVSTRVVTIDGPTPKPEPPTPPAKAAPEAKAQAESSSGTTQRRAKPGGEYGPNGEWYEGGAFIATTEQPKMAKRTATKGGGKQEIEGGKFDVPAEGEGFIYHLLRPVSKGMGAVDKLDPAFAENFGISAKTAQTLAEKFNAGERTYKIADYPDLAKRAGITTTPEEKAQAVSEAVEAKPKKDRTAQSHSERITQVLNDAESAAKERIAKRGRRAYSDPLGVLTATEIADYSIIGAAKIGKGLVKLADWSAAMVKEHGERIRPHLDEIWRRANSLKKSVADVATLEEAAMSRSDWKDWYDRHDQTIKDIFGSDAEKFQEFLSATGQATSVPSNTALALKAYRQWKEGKPFEGYLEGATKNLERAAKGEPLQGVKISQYGNAGRGIDNGIAIDRHLGRVLFNSDSLPMSRHEAGWDIVQTVADKLGWKGREVQAALWAYNQVRNGISPENVQSYDKVLQTPANRARIDALKADGLLPADAFGTERFPELPAANRSGKRGSVQSDASTSGGDGTGAQAARQKLVAKKAAAQAKLNSRVKASGTRLNSSTGVPDPGVIAAAAELFAYDAAIRAIDVATALKEYTAKASGDVKEFLTTHRAAIIKAAEEFKKREIDSKQEAEKEPAQPRITRISKGVDDSRIQQGQPPYFVNWEEDGERRYKFFSQVAPMYKLFERLKEMESRQSQELPQQKPAPRPRPAQPTEAKLAAPARRPRREAQETPAPAETPTAENAPVASQKPQPAPQAPKVEESPPPPPEPPKDAPKESKPAENANARKLLKIDVQQEIAQELGVEDWTERSALKRGWQATFAAASENWDAFASAVRSRLAAGQTISSDEERIVAMQMQRDARQKVRELIDSGVTGPELDGAIAEVAALGRAITIAGSEAGRSLALGRALFDDSPGGFMKALTRAEKASEGKMSEQARRDLAMIARQGEKIQEAIDQDRAARAKEAEAYYKARRRTSTTRTAPASKAGEGGTPNSGDYGTRNTVFTKERYEAAKARLDKAASVPGAGSFGAPLSKTDTLFRDLVTVGGYHFEAGLRKFGDWAAQMRNETNRPLSDRELGMVWNETVSKSRRFLTDAEVQAAAQSKLDALKDIAGATPKTRQKQTNPLLDIAVEEYAKRAQTAEQWAKSVERRTGLTLPLETRRKLYEQAAGEFAKQNVPIEATKRRMAALAEREVMKTRPLPMRALNTMVEISGSLRSIVTSIDYSGWMNQGGILVVARPKLSAGSEGALAQMFKAGAREEVAEAINGAIMSRQELLYGSKTFFKDIGLELSEIGDDAKLTAREEGFAKGFAEKIPFIGRGVRGSERAYATVLNVLRADTFDAMYEPGMTLEEAKDIARYINVASGRGDIHESYAGAAAAAAHVLFSPRYMVSRVQYLVGQPLFKASSAKTRKLIAKEYARYLYKIALYVTLGIMGGLIKKDLPEKDADGKKLNPVQRIIYGMTSTDTGMARIRVPGTGGGELNLDPYSALKQYIVFANTLLTGQRVPSDKQPMNEEQKKEGMYKVSPGETLSRFARSKLAPVPAQAWTWGIPDRNGEKTDFIGRPASVGQSAMQLLLPMGANEIINGFSEMGVAPAEANKLMIGLGIVGSAALSSFGLRASYRNRNVEQAQREKYKQERKSRKEGSAALEYARSLSPEDLAKPENAYYRQLLKN